MILLKNILQRITIAFTLLSLLIPTVLTLINVNAQENSDQQINVEVTSKDGSKKIKTTTIEELQSNSVLNTSIEEKLAKTELNQEQVQSAFANITPQDLKEIEEKGGVVTDEETHITTTNKVVLTNLGYSSQQIEVIAMLVDNYNSQEVKSVSLILPKQENEITLAVTAKASCEPDFDTRYHWWGGEIIMNNCSVIEANTSFEYMGFVIGALGATPCGWACVVAGGMYEKLAHDLAAANSRCDEQGAILTQLYFPPVWNVYDIC